MTIYSYYHGIMDLLELISSELCFCNVDAPSKKRVINYIADYVNDQYPALDREAIYSGLIQREKLGSTGIGLGIGIPHCRVDICHKMIGVAIKLVQPIDFDSIDGTPVDFIFALIVPQESSQDHLDALSQIAELFNGEDALRNIRACNTKKELYDTLIDSIQQHFGTENPV